MDANNSGDRHSLIDLESGSKELICELDERRNTSCGREQAAEVFNQVWSGLIGNSDLVKGDEDFISENCVSVSVEVAPLILEDSALIENVGMIDSKSSSEKPKKKACKKHPRPPRPPKSPSLDMADEKLMRELSELAALKRARLERMKKRIRNPKSASSNNSSSFLALTITVLFCLVVVWQGVLSHGSSSIRFQGAPEESVQARTGLISVQVYKNVSLIAPDMFGSASPNNVVPIPELQR